MFSLSVTDVTGKTAVEIKAITGSRLEFSRDGLANGFYMLELKNDREIFRSAVVVR